MKRTILYLVTFILVPISAHAQTDIAGSWKQTAFYQKVLSTGERRFPFGEMIIGRIVYSKDGTFCTMTTGADRKQAAAAPTDEERVQLFKTMFAYCGAYRVDGSRLFTKSDVAWTPNWTKRETSAAFTIDGKLMTTESSPFIAQLDGVEVIAVNVYEKE